MPLSGFHQREMVVGFISFLNDCSGDHTSAFGLSQLTAGCWNDLLTAADTAFPGSQGEGSPRSRCQQCPGLCSQRLRIPGNSDRRTSAPSLPGLLRTPLLSHGTLRPQRPLCGNWQGSGAGNAGLSRPSARTSRCSCRGAGCTSPRRWSR